MATERYVCNKCQRVFDIENRKRNKVCTICGSDCRFSRLWDVQVVGGTLYNGSLYYFKDELVIPERVTEIEGSAFKGSGIKAITFSKNLKGISMCAFAECRSLKRIVIPGNVKEIGWSAFRECSDLEEVILSEGVEKIADYAFCECTKLKYVSLPSTLKQIGNHAFNPEYFSERDNTAPSLKVVQIPTSVTEIGKEVFENFCPGKKASSKLRYLVAENSVGEAHLKREGFKYEITNSRNGYAVGEGIIDDILYYGQNNRTKVTIPEGVVTIKDYAFLNFDNIKNVVISSTVSEICAGAFKGCNNLSSLMFNGSPNLKKIGSKAFEGFTGTLIDLPETVEELALDAFPQGCIVSVGGQMPYYSTAVAAIAKQESIIAHERKKLFDLNLKLTDANDKIQKHNASYPNQVKDISKLNRELSIVEKERIEKTGVLHCEREATSACITETEAQIKSLTVERKKCFVWAISKKKDLEEKIVQRRVELQVMENNLADLTAQLEETERNFSCRIVAIKKKINSLVEMQSAWDMRNSQLIADRDSIEKERTTLSASIADLEDKLKKEREALERKHTKWLNERNAEIQRIEQQKREAEERKKIADLIAEKMRIAGSLTMSPIALLPVYRYVARSAVVEESLLNEAFLEMINALNAYNETVQHNDLIASHAKEIERIKEINRALGRKESDSIMSLQIRDCPQILDSYIPKRFVKLAKWFASLEAWKGFKHSILNVIQVAKKNKSANIQDKFFSGVDYFTISNNEKLLLVFPYCMVIYESKTPLMVLTYDQTKIMVEYTDREEITDTVAEFGEVIKEQHKHLNKDGSVSHRYKDNPLIKTVRYTTLTIFTNTDCITFPIKLYQDALRLENSFAAYCRSITTDLTGKVYGLVARSADLSDIETAIDNIAKEEALRLELEAQREAEEQRRFEEERKAALLAAEEKRQAIIQRQKELNEERRRQAEEKRRALQLFEDDFSAEEHEAAEEKNASIMTWFSVVSNTTISNNVFKVVVKQETQFDSMEFVVHFVSEDKKVISNKKKLASGDVEEETTLGFVLDSGIDYTRMKKCFMEITAPDGGSQHIEFKMNIAFYSDF